MPKKDEDEAKKIKVKVVEENTIDSVPPMLSEESETQPSEKAKEEEHSDIGFSEPAPTNQSSYSSPDPDDPSARKDTPFTTLIFAFIGGFLIGALLVGGIFYFKSTVAPGGTAPTPTQESLPTPEATAEPEVDLSVYKVQALNGSGTAGEALKVKELLEKAGFKDVKTGNAKAYDFKETEVAMKKDTPEVVFTEIEKALSGYKVTKADPLAESSAFDVVITVGSQKSE